MFFNDTASINYLNIFFFSSILARKIIQIEYHFLITSVKVIQRLLCFSLCVGVGVCRCVCACACVEFTKYSLINIVRTFLLVSQYNIMMVGTFSVVYRVYVVKWSQLWLLNSNLSEFKNWLEWNDFKAVF